MNVRALGVAVLATVVAAGCGGGARVPVILVSIDTLRADHLNCYGYKARQVSPNVDALARDGVVFESHIAASPWTTPSHMSLLTSLSPTAHGITSSVRILMSRLKQGAEYDRLAAATPTLPEILQRRGVPTAAFTGGVTLDPKFGFGRGFETYEASMMKLRAESMDEMTAWASARRSRPFFLFWHTFETHAPYLGTAFVSEVVPEAQVEATRQAVARYGKRWLKMGWDAKRKQSDMLTDRGIFTKQVCEALYDGSILEMDRWLGTFVKSLRDMGVYDKSLIVFTSDHGEQFGERPVDPDHPTGAGIFNTHGQTLYEEMLRIPLIVKLPRQEHAGLRVKAVTRAVDVMPTILDVMGVAPNGPMEGASLRAAWEGKPAASPAAFSESLLEAFEKKSLRTDRYKFIVSINSRIVADKGRAYVPEDPARELYDLTADPGEKTNLLAPPAAPDDSKTARLFETALRQRLRQKGRADKAPLSEEEIEKLKALGYVDTD